MSLNLADTIVAIATPPGRGGIGVVRLSGPDAHWIAQRVTSLRGALEPRRATVTFVRAAADDRMASTAVEAAAAQPFDEVVAVYFAAPASYTGEDVIELSAHGSPVVLRRIVEAAVTAGARLAEPGEFTLRAFLNGRMDLLQAEAVADLVGAVTPLQASTAFDQLQGTLTEVIGEIDRELFELIARLEASVDFPEEGYHFVDPGELAGAIDRIVGRTSTLLAHARCGRLIREGLLVAIVGKPNVGKSSLFNRLAGASRAIVTEVPGTTRDMVTEVIDVHGLAVTLVDTAGLRQPGDPVEAEGVRRSERVARTADLVVVVLDRSEPLSGDDEAVLAATEGERRPRILVANKADLDPAWLRDDVTAVSAATGAGLGLLRQGIVAALDVEPVQDRPEMTNLRHITLVERAHAAMERARVAATTEGGSMSEEFVLADLQEARGVLEEVTGRRATDEVLAYIFSRFCIGK